MDTKPKEGGTTVLDKLLSTWRARRVLIVGGKDALTPWMNAILSELGARPVCVTPGCGAEALCRVMNDGRVSAVIIPAAHTLHEGGLEMQLSALSTLLCEVREAGVPLTILCSDASVYRASEQVWYAREEDPLGGRTREGLIQSILQLYADGMSRGLLGDAVTTLLVRHMPCLFSDSPFTRQYARWCRELLAGEPLHVEHPGMQGIFMHPLDVACGALMLGARFLSGEDMQENVFNLSTGPDNLCANRSAALRLVNQHGGTRPLVESEPPLPPRSPLLDGSRARYTCGFRCRISAGAALSQLLEWTRAAQNGEEAQVLVHQTRAYRERMR